MSTYLVDHMRIPILHLGIARLRAPVGTGVITAAPGLLGDFTAPTAAAAVSSPAG